MLKKYILFIIIVWMVFNPSEYLFGSLGTKVRICTVKGTVQTGAAVIGDYQNNLYTCPLKQTINQTECRVVNKATMVETGSDGWAYLEYPNGDKIKIGPDTKIIINRMNIYVASGKSWFKIEKTSGGELIVKTPTAILGIRGTEFIVNVEIDGSTNIQLIKGSIEVSDINQQSNLMLVAGMEVTVPKGSLTINTALLNINENDKWWTDWPTLIPIAEMPTDVSNIIVSAFSNALGKPCGSDKEFVRSLYQSVLERDFEVSFATGYGGAHMRSLQDGNSRLVTIHAFFNSPEYLNKQKSGQEFIRDAYQAVLGREPSTNESNQWPRIDRNEIIRQLFNSNEYRLLMAGCPEIGQQTECSFSISGQWTLNQHNGFIGTLNLQQYQSGLFTGSVSWNRHESGKIDGKIIGNAIEFTISYPSGIKGSYKGTLDQNGAKIINGTTQGSSGATATWDATR